MPKQQTTTGRRIGRPRVDQRALELEPAEEILLQAGRLFTAHGFEATTTREIAEAAGLRQGSLFHYFERKDDILVELLDRTVAPALVTVGRIEEIAGSGASRLWALTHQDVSNICSGRYNLAGLSRLPHARQPQFAEFWTKRRHLQDCYERYLVDGQTEGQLQFDDLRLISDHVFGIVEGPIGWFERELHEVEEVAELAAKTVLACTLANQRSLPKMVVEGRKIAAHASGHSDGKAS